MYIYFFPVWYFWLPCWLTSTRAFRNPAELYPSPVCRRIPTTSSGRRKFVLFIRIMWSSPFVSSRDLYSLPFHPLIFFRLRERRLLSVCLREAGISWGERNPASCAFIGPFLVAPEWKGQQPPQQWDYARPKRREIHLVSFHFVCGGDL